MVLSLILVALIIVQPAKAVCWLPQPNFWLFRGGMQNGAAQLWSMPILQSKEEGVGRIPASQESSINVTGNTTACPKTSHGFFYRVNLECLPHLSHLVLTRHLGHCVNQVPFESFPSGSEKSTSLRTGYVPLKVDF